MVPRHVLVIYIVVGFYAIVHRLIIFCFKEKRVIVIPAKVLLNILGKCLTFLNKVL